MINRVNTLAEVTEFQRRLAIEMTSSGLTRIIPEVGQLQLMGQNGCIALMDNGLSPTFAGAERICIILQPEDDPNEPQGWWVHSLFGPTGPLRPDGFGSIHAGIGRWITNRLPVRFPAIFNANSGLFFRRSGLPVVRMAIALAVPSGVVEEGNGIFRLTFANADSQLALNNVVAGTA